jgi:hypothetical protein
MAMQYYRLKTHKSFKNSYESFLRIKTLKALETKIDNIIQISIQILH